MEERNSTQACSRDDGRPCLGAAAPFFVGFVAALVVGWWIFPKVLFTEETQPIEFSHKTHMEEAVDSCEYCHFEDTDAGLMFSGLPTTEQCVDCHMAPLGDTEAELEFVEMIEAGEEVEWLVYQRQPDNAYFSHMAHSLDNCGMCHPEFEDSPQALCNQCHPDLIEAEGSLPIEVNRLTGYTTETMKMWECEECHAYPDHVYDLNDDGHLDATDANNGCHVCHK
ncbi:MAG: cytochrome C [Desulfovibrio sp.]|nr:MAG: cytochrome C [Desulfovibrio sp.]